MTEPLPTRSLRMSAGGKLSFRRRARRVAGDDLPIVEVGDQVPTLRSLVPAGFARIEVEVGPGKGAFLRAAASAAPDTFFVGIEAAGSYARIAAARLAAAEIDNALLLVDNAAEFLRGQVGDGELDRLHVYFPDPWPKRRHRGRRFFANATPAVLARVLAPGAHLLLATDNAALAGENARVLGGSGLFTRDRGEEERLAAAAPGHGFSPTDFERKYEREGRVIRRWAFRCVRVR